jgi:transcriptional repressor NrdR
MYRWAGPAPLRSFAVRTRGGRLSVVQCPYCGSDSSVTETRIAPDGVRRRRICTSCKRRFTTYERVGSPGLKVEKRDGSVEQFDAAKLYEALRRVARRRPNVKDDDLRRITRDIEATLVDAGQRTVRWSAIVTQALRRLEAIDRRSADRLLANYLDDAGDLRLDELPTAEPNQLDLPGTALPGTTEPDD